MKFFLKILVLIAFVIVSGLKTAFSQVAFLVPGGFYQHPFLLTLACASGTIHYTLDGSTPTAQSPTYTSPLLMSSELYSSRNIFLQQISPDDYWNPPSSVNHVIVIRAAAFDDLGNMIGKEKTNTYFISDLTGYTPQLPMLSISIDPECLFDVDSGIFSPNGWEADNDFTTGNFNQHGREWERLANVEFYELNGNGFSQKLGMRVHGGKTRWIMQKSLKFYARKEYGDKYINYPVFTTRPYSSYKRLVLKTFCASWYSNGFSDHLAHSIAAPLRFISLASRPVTVYINGEYWGIYYLQEASDERLIEQIDAVDADDVNIIGSWLGKIENGSDIGFNQLMDFLNSADLSDSLQYQYLCSLIDIDNFIDYQLFEAFIANQDWPANNMRCYQHGTSLWRWIFFDGDAAFLNYNNDMSVPLIYTGEDEWPSSAISTLCFRKLIQSPIFVDHFYARMKELNSTVFKYENTAPLLGSAMGEIQNEINRQSERFNNPQNFSQWMMASREIDNFLRKRTSVFESQMTALLLGTATTSDPYILYPNPAHNVCNVRSNSESMKTVQYEIFDYVGNRLLRDEISVSKHNPYSINISSLPNGIYLVRFLPSGIACLLFVK